MMAYKPVFRNLDRIGKQKNPGFEMKRCTPIKMIGYSNNNESRTMNCQVGYAIKRNLEWLRASDCYEKTAGK
jgi:hypothetical protein